MKLPPNAPRGDPYSNPELARFLGSMEGLPDLPAPGLESAAPPGAKLGERAFEVFERVGEWLPGIALAALFAATGRLASTALAASLDLGASPVSPIGFTIVAGLLFRAFVGVPEVYRSGIAVCVRTALRVGVALLGIRLSLSDTGRIGLAALPIIAATLLSAGLLMTVIARSFKLPGRLAVLIGVGTAICGNSAILAVAPVIGAKDEETSYAIGTITLFGLFALLIHPFVAQAAFDGNPTLAGFFLGTAIHDTAQVAGAAALFAEQFAAPEVVDTAMVTKLVRNVSLALVLPALLLRAERARTSASADERTLLRALPLIAKAVPPFVLGFIAMAALRTAGDLGDQPFGGALDAALWDQTVSATLAASSGLLAVAMAGVGLGTEVAQLRKVGTRPLAAGLALALAVGAVSLVMIRGLSSWLIGTAG